MELTKLSVSLGKTINLGKYESMRVDFSLDCGLSTEDSVDKIKEILLAKLKLYIIEFQQGLGIGEEKEVE